MVEPTKVCADPLCPMVGERQPWSNFYPQYRREDGSIRTVLAYCKPCSRRRAREWEAAHPEKKRAHQARSRMRRRSDPETLAAERVQRREAQRRRRGTPPNRYRVSRLMREASAGPVTIVPVEPFTAWLHTLGKDSGTIASACGLLPREVRRYLNGDYAMASLDVIDRTCLFAGARVDDLYPLKAAA